MAEALAVMEPAAEPEEWTRMPLRDVVRHENDRGRVVSIVGVGACPSCSHQGEAEAGRRLFCPQPECAAAVLAVLPAGGRA